MQGDTDGAWESPLRVLGVDPGTRVAGWAVLELGSGASARVVDCGPVRLPAGDIPRRLGVLHDELRAVVERLGPAALAVETVFHGKSFHSAVKVGEARGAVLLLGEQAGLEVTEFTPATVKKAVTGNGRAPKGQVQRMVARLLDLDTVPEPSDVADALAIAFCYGQRRNQREPSTGTKRGTERAASPRHRFQELVDRARRRDRAARPPPGRSGGSGA